MKKIMLATLLVSVAVGGPALADQGKRPIHHRMGDAQHMVGRKAMMRMDADKSGDVDRSEFTTALAEKARKRFDRLDANHDGMISQSEYDSMIAQKSELRFAWLDRNHDGKISADDMMGPGGHGRQGHDRFHRRDHRRHDDNRSDSN